MTQTARTQHARDLYHAFAGGNRELVESMLADEFTFSSPLDIGSTVRSISSGAGRAPAKANSSSSCGCTRLGTT